MFHPNEKQFKESCDANFLSLVTATNETPDLFATKNALDHSQSTLEAYNHYESSSGLIEPRLARLSAVRHSHDIELSSYSG